jgi:hypothetical protein
VKREEQSLRLDKSVLNHNHSHSHNLKEWRGKSAHSLNLRLSHREWKGRNDKVHLRPVLKAEAAERVEAADQKVEDLQDQEEVNSQLSYKKPAIRWPVFLFSPLLYIIFIFAASSSTTGLILYDSPRNRKTKNIRYYQSPRCR